MITIRFKSINHQISFSSKGHANYDDFGKDIVCSAVSSIIIGALNAIKDIDSFDIKISEGNVTLNSKKECSSHDEIVLETMMIQLYTVEEQYKDFLKIIKE